MFILGFHFSVMMIKTFPGNFSLPHGNSTEPLQERDVMNADSVWARLLLSTACTPLDNLFAWKNSPVVPE